MFRTKFARPGQSIFSMLVAIFACIGLGACAAPTATSPAGTPPVSTKPAVPTAVTVEPTQEPELTSCRNPDNPLPLSPSTAIPGSIFLQDGRQVVTIGGAITREHVIANLAIDEWPIGLSSNGNLFAVGSGLPPVGIPITLRVLASDGRVMSSTVSSDQLPIENRAQGGGWTFTRWINDKLMLVYVNNMTQAAPLQFMATVVDPFSGSIRSDLLGQLPDRLPSGGVSFSPDLTRALYIVDDHNQYRLVLWDMVRNTELWRYEPFSNETVIEGTRVGNIPVNWSPDSATVAFVDWPSSKGSFVTQLVVMDRDGQQVTQLKSNFLGGKVNGLSWSPDGKYLAAETTVAGDNWQPVLVVYPMATHKELAICRFKTGIDLRNNVLTAAFLWSPDGRFLAFSIGPALDPLSVDNVIAVLDTKSGELTSLAHGSRVSLLGWSGNEAWLGH